MRCGANSVTYPPEFWGNKTSERYIVDSKTLIYIERDCPFEPKAQTRLQVLGSTTDGLVLSDHPESCFDAGGRSNLPPG